MRAPKSKAVARFIRTGVIPPGHEDEVAAYLARTNGRDQE